MTDIGPYMNSEGDWWVPVAGNSLKAARAEVVSCLPYRVPQEGKLAYIGKEMAWLGGDDPFDRAHQAEMLAYHFEERSRY
jgi:hypothetical protein